MRERQRFKLKPVNRLGEAEERLNTDLILLLYRSGDFRLHGCR
jgi:hypothetical protein